MAAPKTSSLKIQDLVVLASLLAIGAVIYFVTIPQAAALKLKTTELSAKTAEIGRLETQIESLRSFQAKLPQYQSAVTRLGIAYPKEEQQVEALIQAQALVERSGMSVDTLSPGKAKQGSLPISLSLKGSYLALGNLLRELNSNLRPVLVESLNIASGNEKEAGTLSVTLSTGFQFAGGAAAPAAGLPAADAAASGAAAGGASTVPTAGAAAKE